MRNWKIFHAHWKTFHSSWNVFSFWMFEKSVFSFCFWKIFLLGIELDVDSFSFYYFNSVASLSFLLHRVWKVTCCYPCLCSFLHNVSFIPSYFLYFLLFTGFEQFNYDVSWCNIFHASFFLKASGVSIIFNSNYF